MKLQMVGCSHYNSPVEVRQRLAFNPDQAREALARFRGQFPETEAVLLSTCNRVELYTAAQGEQDRPTREDAAAFLAGFHEIKTSDALDHLPERKGADVIRHLFTVAASLDSMVVGEAQILSQVKKAYRMAADGDSVGPLLHAAFQAAIRVAKRVTTETAVQERRVSIPSVAVADFARSIFERFDDKHVLVIGAGEMGEETLLYLIHEGAEDVVIVNRSPERAEKLAARYRGRAEPWDRLDGLLVEADLIVSTTGAGEPIVTLDRYRRIERDRFQRPLFILDLAVPRDFDPAVGGCLGVYLYSIDDLESACEANREARAKELPKAEKIIEEETARFMADLHHRATAPTIRLLQRRAAEVKEEELRRLLNKLGDLDDHRRDEIGLAFDRLVGKLLHPPLESLRDESRHGVPHGLLDALRKLFQLKE